MDKNTQKRTIEFKTIDNFQPGQIFEILKKSYAGLIDFFPHDKERFYKQWKQEDNDAFNNPIIGRHLFFTCLDNLPVGYFSWDDRQYPIGIIGQNCILPEYRGQEYGIKQIKKMIHIFEDKGFNEIRVITGDHVFFKPAQMTYTKNGFKELKRTKGDLFGLIEYYMLIESPEKIK